MKPQATTIRPESASPVDTRLFAVRKRWRKVRAVTGRCTPENIKVGGPHSTRFATSVCGAGSIGLLSEGMLHGVEQIAEQDQLYQDHPETRVRNALAGSAPAPFPKT
jgi:acetylornithine deacetylase/succinyl-diaminopimelate desuccinylase-like protein